MSRLMLFLIKRYAHYTRETAAIVGCMLVMVSFTTSLSFVSKTIVDRVIAEKNERLLGILLAVLLGGFLIHAACHVYKQYLLVRLGVDMQNDVRLQMFGHLQQLPVSYFGRVGRGTLTSRFTNDLASLQAAFLSLAQVAHALLAIIVYSDLNAWLHWSLALWSLAGAVLSLVMPALLNPLAMRLNDTLKSRQSAVQDLIQEHIGVQKTVRAFNLSGWEYDRLKQTTGGLASLARRAAFVLQCIPLSVSSVLLLSQLVSLTAGAYLAIRGTISIGTLLAFQTIFLGIGQQVRELAKHIPALSSATASCSRIEQLLEEAPEYRARTEAAASSMERVDKQIALNNVSFSYDSRTPILEGLQLTIPAGRYAAIIGVNGSGKSTLVNLIMRFYEPTTGSVEFDGTDTRVLPPETVREMIGYVSQDTELMQLSIMDNIRLGKTDVPDRAVIEVARLAGIHDWIAGLPRATPRAAGRTERYCPVVKSKGSL